MSLPKFLHKKKKEKLRSRDYIGTDFFSID